MNKRASGFTLLEAVIALAWWGILLSGLMSIWAHTARTTLGVVATQDAFENARASMDAILINIQMADTILLETDDNHVLKRLSLDQRDPNGNPHRYIFYFNVHARPGEAKYHRLEFGLNDEFASQIASVKLERRHENYLRITIETNGESAEAITLTGVADIRYKDVTVMKN